MSELSWLRSLVKHNVAAKHGSSKTLTSNELWLLDLRIKSIRILASICIMGYVQIVYHCSFIVVAHEMQWRFWINEQHQVYLSFTFHDKL